MTLPSTVSIAKHGRTFHGRVGSANAACRGDRRVKLYLAFAKRQQVIGHAKTDAKGRWKIPLDLSASAYAVVRQRSEGTAGTIYVCAAGRSATV